MSKNGLHRHYDRLEPEERFRLDVLAMARGDAVESERLVSTCPKFAYRMNDRGFSGRWTGTMEITLRIYLELSRYLDKLQMSEAFRAVLPYAQRLTEETATQAYFDGHGAGRYHAWNNSGKTGHPPDIGDEELAVDRDLAQLETTVKKYGELLPTILGRLERELAGEAITLWEGFAGFCTQHIGLEAEKVLKVVVEPGAERLENLKSLGERLELVPNLEKAEEIREGLAEAWGTIIEKGV
jgi:hypothetical protein